MIHLFLASEDSLEFHPQNSSYDFTCELTEPLTGNFKCALSEISYINSSKDLYVFCDICEQSFVHNLMAPIIRIVREPGEIINPYFFTVTRNNIHRVRIYIRDKKFETPTENIGHVRCTLLLQRI